MGELHREERGSGAPLLLIHGNGANTLTWGRTFDDLAVGHRVISYDRRGFGRSPGPPAARMSDHVADAAALLEELDAAPAAVLGWSAGGVVAIDAGPRRRSSTTPSNTATAARSSTASRPSGAPR